MGPGLRDTPCPTSAPSSPWRGPPLTMLGGRQCAPRALNSPPGAPCLPPPLGPPCPARGFPTHHPAPNLGPLMPGPATTYPARTPLAPPLAPLCLTPGPPCPPLCPLGPSMPLPPRFLSLPHPTPPSGPHPTPPRSHPTGPPDAPPWVPPCSPRLPPGAPRPPSLPHPRTPRSPPKAPLPGGGDGGAREGAGGGRGRVTAQAKFRLLSILGCPGLRPSANLRKNRAGARGREGARSELLKQ